MIDYDFIFDDLADFVRLKGDIFNAVSDRKDFLKTLPVDEFRTAIVAGNSLDSSAHRVQVEDYCSVLPSTFTHLPFYDHFEVVQLATRSVTVS
ncbi:hypothetical protein TNCV_1153751 [Trichonephila clavipes]|nr:hypothetical protein TNCV_1153751 [Trichonephila clavipes]